jgi:hypothetical protein
MALSLFQIGINDYPGTANDLAGCVNDCKDLAPLTGVLAPVRLLNKTATKANIIKKLTTFAKSLAAGDWGIVQYSGHGSWEPDKNKDEPDGRDECLCPYDWTNSLLDDELFNIWKLVHKQAKILLITDSCMNGTVYRLGMPMQAKKKSTRVRFIPPSLRLGVQDTAGHRRALQISQRAVPAKKEALPPNVIHLAGSLNTEYCYDAVFNGRPNGAFTKVFIDARKSFDAPPTFQQLIDAIRQMLPSSDYPQTPVLNATAANKKLVMPF